MTILRLRVWDPLPHVLVHDDHALHADTSQFTGHAPSLHACESLTAEGYTQLINMDGGFSGRPDPSGGPGVPGWQARGYPVSETAEEGRDWDSMKGAQA